MKSISLKVNHCDPYKSSIRGFTAIARFFQFYSPNIDSRLSKRIDLQNDEIDVKKEFKIDVLSKIQPNTLEKRGVIDDEINRKDFRGFVFKHRDETDLEALLRTIRNSIAHADMFISKNKKVKEIVFRNTKNNKTNALFITTHKALKDLKEHLCFKYVGSID